MPNKSTTPAAIPPMPLELIERRIYVIRGHRVMLDADLAELYEVETRALNQAVRRNGSRFPEDFMFQLTRREAAALRSQFVTLKKGRGRHSKYSPLAFKNIESLAKGVKAELKRLQSPRRRKARIGFISE
jgi:ORF6N domain-containing protein